MRWRGFNSQVSASRRARTRFPGQVILGSGARSRGDGSPRVSLAPQTCAWTRVSALREENMSPSPQEIKAFPESYFCCTWALKIPWASCSCRQCNKLERTTWGRGAACNKLLLEMRVHRARGLLDGLQQRRIHQKSTGQQKRSPIKPTTSNPCNLTSCHLSPASPCLAGWTWQDTAGGIRRAAHPLQHHPQIQNTASLRTKQMESASFQRAQILFQPMHTQSFSQLPWVSGGAGGCPLYGTALKAGCDKTHADAQRPHQHTQCSHHPSLVVPSSFIPGAAPGPQKHTDYFGSLCAQPKTRAQNPRFHVQLKQEKKLLATQDLEGK